MAGEIIAQKPVDLQLEGEFNPGLDVERAQKAAKALMVVIDATKPLVMNGKRYLYFEHWQTVAKFFNTTVGIEKTEKTDKGYIAKAVVYNKEGVVIGGAEASCMNDEKNWKGKPDFQLRSMAQTRAMAKALRSIYGFVAVLAGVEPTPAEEMETRPVSRSKASKLPVAERPKTFSKECERLEEMIDMSIDVEQLEAVGATIEAKLTELKTDEVDYLRSRYANRLRQLRNVNNG